MNPNLSEGKLQLYGQLKDNLNVKQEDYLVDVKNKHHRIALTKVRITSHNLAIETGRYGTQRISRNLRFCCYCNNGMIENEEQNVKLMIS